jgi:hypothetical protein
VQGFAEHSRAFAVGSYNKDAAGVTIITSQGLMRIEVCADRIIHVLVTPEENLPKQLLITVPKLSYSLKADGERPLLSTAALTVEITRNTGAVPFMSLDGKRLLQEPSRVFTRFDFWTGKKSAGGQTIEADAPIEGMPILVKSGSIVALDPIVASTKDKKVPTDIRVYDRTHTLTVGNRQSSFPGMAKERTLRVFVVREGAGVGIDGQSKPGAVVHYNGSAQLIKLAERLREDDRSQEVKM